VRLVINDKCVELIKDIEKVNCCPYITSNYRMFLMCPHHMRISCYRHDSWCVVVSYNKVIMVCEGFHFDWSA